MATERKKTMDTKSNVTEQEKPLREILKITENAIGRLNEATRRYSRMNDQLTGAQLQRADKADNEAPTNHGQVGEILDRVNTLHDMIESFDIENNRLNTIVVDGE